MSYLTKNIHLLLDPKQGYTFTASLVLLGFIFAWFIPAPALTDLLLIQALFAFMAGLSGLIVMFTFFKVRKKVVKIGLWLLGVVTATLAFWGAIMSYTPPSAYLHLEDAYIYQGQVVFQEEGDFYPHIMLDADEYVFIQHAQKVENHTFRSFGGGSVEVELDLGFSPNWLAENYGHRLGERFDLEPELAPFADPIRNRKALESILQQQGLLLDTAEVIEAQLRQRLCQGEPTCPVRGVSLTFKNKVNLF